MGFLQGLLLALGVSVLVQGVDARRRFGASDIPDTMTMDTFFSPNSINNPYSFRRGHRELLEAPLRRPRKPPPPPRRSKKRPSYNRKAPSAPSGGGSYGGAPLGLGIPYGNALDPRSNPGFAVLNKGYVSPEYVPGAAGAGGQYGGASGGQYGGGDVSGGQYGGASGGQYGGVDAPGGQYDAGAGAIGGQYSGSGGQYAGSSSSPSQYPPGDGKQAYDPYSSQGQGYGSQGQGEYGGSPSSDGSYGGNQGYGYGDSGPGYSSQDQGDNGGYNSGAREYSDSYGGQDQGYGGQGDSYSQGQDQGYSQEGDYSQDQGYSQGQQYSQDGGYPSEDGYSQGQYPQGRSGGGYPGKGGQQEEEDFDVVVGYADGSGGVKEVEVVDSHQGNSQYQEYGSSEPSYNTDYHTEMGLNPSTGSDYLSDQPLNDAPLGSPRYNYDRPHPRAEVPQYVEERVHVMPTRRPHPAVDKLKETVEPYKYFGRQKKLTQTYSRYGPSQFTKGDRVYGRIVKRKGAPQNPNDKPEYGRKYVRREEVFEETNHIHQQQGEAVNHSPRPAHYYSPVSEGSRKLRPQSYEPRPLYKSSPKWKEHVHPYSPHNDGKTGHPTPYYNSKPHDTAYFSYQIHQFTRPEPYLETDHHPQARPFSEPPYYSRPPQGRQVLQYREDAHRETFLPVTFTQKDKVKPVTSNRPQYAEYPDVKEHPGFEEKSPGYSSRSLVFNNRDGDRGYTLRHVDKSRTPRDWPESTRGQFTTEEIGSQGYMSRPHGDPQPGRSPPGGFGYQGNARQVIHGTMDDFSHSARLPARLPARPLLAPLQARQGALYGGQGRSLDTNRPVSPQPQYKPALPVIGVPRVSSPPPQLTRRSKRLMYGLPMSLTATRGRPQQYMTLVDPYRPRPQRYPLRALPYDYQRRLYKVSNLRGPKRGESNSGMMGSNFDQHMVSNYRSIINSELPGGRL